MPDLCNVSVWGLLVQARQVAGRGDVANYDGIVAKLSLTLSRPGTGRLATNSVCLRNSDFERGLDAARRLTMKLWSDADVTWALSRGSVPMPSISGGSMSAAFAMALMQVATRRSAADAQDVVCSDLRRVAITGSLDAENPGEICPVSGVDTKGDTLLNAAADTGIGAVIVPMAQLEAIATLPDTTVRRYAGNARTLHLRRLNPDSGAAHEILAYGAQTIDDAFGWLADVQSGAVLHL
jgi:hypothetical protein